MEPELELRAWSTAGSTLPLSRIPAPMAYYRAQAGEAWRALLATGMALPMSTSSLPVHLGPPHARTLGSSGRAGISGNALHCVECLCLPLLTSGSSGRTLQR